MSRAVTTVLLLAACAEEVRVASNEQADRFTVVREVPPADVLFVVDDSASMAEEQARLAADVRVMVEILGDAAVDVHVGVVTTDLDRPDAARLVGGVMRDVDAIRTGLADALLAGLDGARREQGLAAALAALDGRNPGFRRDDASLEVIVLSDEDDQSDGDVVDLQVDLERLAPVGFRMHGVIGDLPAGCFSDDGAADPCPRYAALIEATGGHQESICAASYTGILERLARELTGVADTFRLRHVPEPSTLVVRVDGADVPEAREDGWTYEPAPNAVVFHGAAVPGAGQEVEIRYRRLAGVTSPP